VGVHRSFFLDLSCPHQDFVGAAISLLLAKFGFRMELSIGSSARWPRFAVLFFSLRLCGSFSLFLLQSHVSCPSHTSSGPRSGVLSHRVGRNRFHSTHDFLLPGAHKLSVLLVRQPPVCSPSCSRCSASPPDSVFIHHTGARVLLPASSSKGSCFSFGLVFDCRRWKESQALDCVRILAGEHRSYS
jgi:hypothetical protein